MRTFRIYQILNIIYSYRLFELLPNLSWRWRPLIWLGWLFFPCAWLPADVVGLCKRSNKIPVEDRLVAALIQLGPLFIKFGQILSLRLELLSPAMIKALSTLHDSVPPFSGQLARQMITKQFKQSPELLFQQFNDTPLAAASIAQVHEATLTDGTQVVIKLLRPKVRQSFRRDMAVLHTVTKLLLYIYPRFEPLNLLVVIEQIDKLIQAECDLRYEAANCSLVKHHFHHDFKLHVPKVYWEYSRSDMMVIDKVNGIPINDLDALNALGVNLKKLAHHGVAIFFTQVFEHGFFHGDMHPGNIFVDASDPDNPRYITIDFGIMGSVTLADQKILAHLFLAFFDRDYREVACVLQHAGWTTKNANMLELEGLLRQTLEPFFDQPLSCISFGQVLIGLFHTASTLQFTIPSHLILLQKTLLNIESLGKQLYPDLDLWETAQPFLTKFKKARYGRKGLWRAIKKAWPDWVTEVPELPHLLHQFLILRTKS